MAPIVSFHNSYNLTSLINQPIYINQEAAIISKLICVRDRFCLITIMWLGDDNDLQKSSNKNIKILRWFMNLARLSKPFMAKIYQWLLSYTIIFEETKFLCRSQKNLSLPLLLRQLCKTKRQHFNVLDEKDITDNKKYLETAQTFLCDKTKLRNKNFIEKRRNSFTRSQSR